MKHCGRDHHALLGWGLPPYDVVQILVHLICLAPGCCLLSHALNLCMEFYCSQLVLGM